MSVFSISSRVSLLGALFAMASGLVLGDERFVVGTHNKPTGSRRGAMRPSRVHSTSRADRRKQYLKDKAEADARRGYGFSGAKLLRKAYSRRLGLATLR